MFPYHSHTVLST